MITHIKNKEVSLLTKFIDFDSNDEIFYNNLYFCEQKIVVKIPLIKKEKPKETSKDDVKITEFDLTKYTYLLSYK